MVLFIIISSIIYNINIKNIYRVKPASNKEIPEYLSLTSFLLIIFYDKDNKAEIQRKLWN